MHRSSRCLMRLMQAPSRCSHTMADAAILSRTCLAASINGPLPFAGLPSRMSLTEQSKLKSLSVPLVFPNLSPSLNTAITSKDTSDLLVDDFYRTILTPSLFSVLLPSLSDRQEDVIQASSVVKKRRSKMRKHKHKKLRRSKRHKNENKN